MKNSVWIIILVMMCAPVWAAGGNLGHGSGTAINPYLIEDLNDFYVFCSYPMLWNAHTRLENDLDLSSTCTFPHAPIAGQGNDSYTGHFDGNYHIINNLSIDGEDYVGLFGYLGIGSTVVNLGIKNAKINGVIVAGALCGINKGSITNCYSTGTVTAVHYAGGLCGQNFGYLIETGNIVDSHSSCTVNASTYAGGLCGKNYHSRIIDCYATGIVKGSVCIGGLCGMNDGDCSPTCGITNCYASGNITGDVSVGGLCGKNEDSPIKTSFSSGTVQGNDGFIGGLCGENTSTILNCYSNSNIIGKADTVGGLCGLNKGTLMNCYSTGIVTGQEPIGGFCATSIGSFCEIQNCFWDVETSCVGFEGQNHFGAIGMSTAQIQSLSIFTTAGWDFIGDLNGTADTWWMPIASAPKLTSLGCPFDMPGDANNDCKVNIIDLGMMAEWWLVDCFANPEDCSESMFRL